MHEVAQTLVVLVAGGTALEMGAHAWDSGVGLSTAELELHVLVEFLEAPVAEQFGICRAEQPLENLVVAALVH